MIQHKKTQFVDISAEPGNSSLNCGELILEKNLKLTKLKMVRMVGLEPTTSPLSVECSNQTELHSHI